MSAVSTSSPRGCSARRVMVAAAIIVKGYTDVGDGFSAGVIVALAIALRYVTLGAERAERGLPILRHAPAVAAGGLLIALAVGFFPVAARRPAVHAPARPGEQVVKLGTLELITRGGVRRRRLPARLRRAGRRSSTTSRGSSRRRDR